jgi:hypothetical protein
MKARAAASPANPLRHLARLTFVAFLLTFIASRTLVILIMARKMPHPFLNMGGTHVHHLNYGIFLLSAVAGVLLFAPRWQRLRAHGDAADRGVVLHVAYQIVEPCQ